MTEPVDVQAERLRALADRFRNAAPGYVSAGERALGEALDEALALLAGQAEQIELLTAERDNLRDALRRLYATAAHDLIGYTSCAGCIAAHDADGEWWLTAAVRDGHEEDCPYFAVQVARAALRAAAVGERPTKTCTLDACAYGNFYCPNGCLEVVEPDAPASRATEQETPE